MSDNISRDTQIDDLNRADTRKNILYDIECERNRQSDLKRSGKFHWTCADSILLDKKMSVLSEETGEVAREIVDYGISVEKYEREHLDFPNHRHVFFLQQYVLPGVKRLTMN